MSSNSNNISRRKALAVIGATGTSTLAGCTGGNNSGNSSGGTAGSAGDSSNSVTITLWSNIQGQSEPAKIFMQDQVNKYEKRTGNKIKWLQEPVTNVQNGNWLQRMQNGQIPTLYQTAFSRMGAFVKNDLVTPWGDVLNQLDDSVVSGTKWAHDSVKNVFRGFDGNKLKMMPLGFVMQEPFVARKDHFKKAGLSIEDDFPPENYDELIQLATTLQEDGPADIGFQVHGAQGDLMDEITPTWAHERGGQKGLYVNKAWDDTNLDSDVWKWSLGKQVEIVQKKGLSSKNAATTSDEDAIRLITSGQASMSQVGMLGYGLFASQAPQLLKDGTIQFGPSWEGKSGYRGEFNMNGIGIGSKPPKTDSTTWKNKRKAAVQFVNQLGSVKVQKDVFDKWGLLPFNRDAWKKIPSKKNGMFETAKTIAKNSEYGWQAHPDMADIQYNIPGPIFQRAINGQISAEKACDQAAKQIRQRVFQ